MIGRVGVLWQAVALVLGLGFVTGLTSTFAQSMVDMSCNGLQLTQQRSRLDRVASELSPEQRERFEDAILRFRRKFETLRQGADQVEKTYRGIYNKHLEAAALANPDVIRRLGETVRSDNPSLEARLGRNDQNAKIEFQQAMIAKLNADPQFSRDLNRRLERNGAETHQIYATWTRKRRLLAQLANDELDRKSVV